jgi:NADPH:quinone reductase-like Zn-dependent oxidoreductase
MPNGGLPKSMTSIAIREPGGPDVLVAREQPVPAPGDGEILVRLAAAGVNRPDVMQRQGHYPPPKGATEIPGLEIAGEVVRIGRIGTTAIQLGKAFGARVIVTAGTPEKCDACRRLGADLAINYHTEDFVALSKQATQGAGVDLILDMVGGDYVGRNYEAAAVEGRIVQIAFLASSRLTVDLMRLMLKRLTHTGSTLRARAVADKAAIAQAVEKNVLPLLASGRVKPLIDSTFPLAQASAAHARMESGKHIGKIVLTL